MSILLDQCVPRRYLRLLHEWGYAASPLADHAAIDSLDERVIAVAQSLDAVLLTIDLDFANILDYPPRDNHGIIVLRYRAMDEGTLDATLRQLLEDRYRNGLRGILAIVDVGRYRVRR